MIKKMLNYTLFFILFLCCFIVDVSAASYTGFDYSAQLYDNLGPTLSSATTSGPAAGTGQYEGYIAYNANSSGGAWGISSPVTLIANHTYTLTANIPNECGTPKLSTYNRIGVGTSLSNAKTSYQNNTNVTEVYSKAIGNNTYLIQYAFTPTINASFIVFPFATSVTCTSSRTILESVAIEDLGVDGVTQDEINSSLNQQTTTITENITNMGEEISGSIEENFNNCKDSVNIDDIVLGTISGVDGSSSDSTSRLRTNSFTYVNPNKNYTLSLDSESTIQIFIFEYDKGKNFIQRIPVSWADVPYTFTTDSNTNYIKIVFANTDSTDISISDVSNVKLTGKICTNKIDETNDKLDETNENLNDIEDALTDDSSPDTSDLADSAGWLPPGPLDSILNLPLSMLNSINNSLSDSCTPIALTLPFVNHSFELPCISTLIQKMGGNNIWTWVGSIASVLILYSYLLNLYSWVDKKLSLKEEDYEGWGGV